MKRLRLIELDGNQQDMYIIEFIIILLCLLSEFMLICSGKLETLSGTSIFNVTAHLICTLLALIILIGCVFLNNSGKVIENPFFSLMLAGNCFGMFMSSSASFTEDLPEAYGLRVLIFTVIYLVSPLMVFLYWNYYLRERKRKTSYTTVVSYVINFMMILLVALCGMNTFGGFFFIVNEKGEYVRTAMYPMVIIFLAATCFIIVLYVWMDESLSIKEKVIYSLYPVMPLVAGIIQSVADGVTLTNIVEFFALQLIYSQIYVQQSRVMAEQEARLARQKMDIMISQMQPHFVFNALNTICYLCRINPKQAESTTKDFAEYLRANLDELGKENIIPFEKEKHHAEIYLGIEKLRFGDAFDVEWDLEVTDFSLPALTIQPLVENSVKYGMAGRRKGGLISITTRKGVNNVLIEIKDNGCGFDPSKPFSSDRSHIGMENVKSRIEDLLGGTMTITSAIGEGTSILLCVPLEE